MVLKKFIEYTKFVTLRFKIRAVLLLSASSINAISDLLLVFSLSKIIENPDYYFYGISIKIIFAIGIFIKFLDQLVFSILLKTTMTRINLFIIETIFKNICSLPSLKVYNLNEDEYKGMVSFQINQLNQIVLLPFIRVVSDMFVFLIIIYFLFQLSFNIFVFLFIIILFYGVFLKFINIKIQSNAEIIFRQYKSIIYFSENFFNGRLDFASYKKNYFFKDELKNIYSRHQLATNENVLLGSLKKLIFEFLIFSFLLIQLISGNLVLSELTVLFFILIRLIPITNNLNLFFSNLNLNKDVVLKVLNSVYGVF